MKIKKPRSDSTSGFSGVTLVRYTAKARSAFQRVIKGKTIKGNQEVYDPEKAAPLVCTWRFRDQRGKHLRTKEPRPLTDTCLKYLAVWATQSEGYVEHQFGGRKETRCGDCRFVSEKLVGLGEFGRQAATKDDVAQMMKIATENDCRGLHTMLAALLKPIKVPCLTEDGRKQAEWMLAQHRPRMQKGEWMNSQDEEPKC